MPLVRTPPQFQEANIGLGRFRLFLVSMMALRHGRIRFFFSALLPNTILKLKEVETSDERKRRASKNCPYSKYEMHSSTSDSSCSSWLVSGGGQSVSPPVF